MRSRKEKNYILHVSKSCNIIIIELSEKIDGTHEYRIIIQDHWSYPADVKGRVRKSFQSQKQIGQTENYFQRIGLLILSSNHWHVPGVL